MGLLIAVNRAPLLIFGLLAGAWVDRVRRAPLLIGLDIGRAALLGVIPLCWVFDALSMPVLYLSTFLIGALSVFFNIAHTSYVPSLVPRGQLIDANSKLATTRSISQIAGPGIAGGLVQFLTAPFALVIDSISFLLSAVFLWRISEREVEPSKLGNAGAAIASIRHDVTTGIRFVMDQPIVRASAASASTYNFFNTMLVAVYILFLSRDLDLSPAAIGVILAAVGPGGLIGSLIASRLAVSYGVGRIVCAGLLLAGAANLLIPFVFGPATVVIAILLIAGFLNGLGQPLYNVNQLSLRQAVTPLTMLGRMSATNQVFVGGPAVLAAVLGGILGEIIGARGVMLVGACGTILAAGWVIFSPVRQLKAIPVNP